MSRRRNPRRKVADALSLSLECAEGKGGTPHALYRIARVTVRSTPSDWEDRAEHFVREVRYVHLADERAESDNTVRETAQGTHRTRTFRCRECGRNVPMKDDKLAELVAELAKRGVSRLQLARISEAMR